MMPTTERRIEKLVSGILRVGVTISASVIALGFAVYLISAALQPAKNPLYSTQASPLATGLITIGLFLLILTPVSRVAVAAVAYAHAKDKGMTIVATIVLAMLALSFAVGLLLS
jgi:uncharacterized membrane protein